jgi:hypothetical protein
MSFALRFAQGWPVSQADVSSLRRSSCLYRFRWRTWRAGIDRRLNLLKVHLPYHESDHVLDVAYNILAGGTCLQDIELQRKAEAYLDALGAQRIPGPTTEGDFCRRFKVPHIEALMETINEVRLGVWKLQPAEFFEQAVIDADGTLGPTWGQCKEGMDISYKGQWGYHPLLVSLANTGEPLYLVNPGAPGPAVERGGGRAVRSGGGPVPAGGVQEDPVPRRRGLHAYGGAGPPGRAGRRAVHLRDRRHVQLDDNGGLPAPIGLETAGSAAQVRGSHSGAMPAGERQRTDRPGAGV